MNEGVQDLAGGTAHIAELALELAGNYGPPVLLALVTLLVGLWLINHVTRMLHRAMEGRAVEPSLARFLTSLSSIGLKILLLISVVGMLGVETASFIAVLATAGLAVGLALQGSLSNFAGGVLILLFRPYLVGQVVEAQGTLGTVAEIGILYTVIKTFDNRTVIIPNGTMANDKVINLSLEEKRRAEWVIGVSYEDDLRRVRETLEGVLAGEQRILDEPESMIVVSEFADSSVNFLVRAWVLADDLWPVTWAVNEQVKRAFDEAGITIPFPQRHLYVHNETSAD